MDRPDGETRGQSNSLCVTGEVTLMERNEAREMRKPNTPCG